MSLNELVFTYLNWGKARILSGVVGDICSQLMYTSL